MSEAKKDKEDSEQDSLWEHKHGKVEKADEKKDNEKTLWEDQQKKKKIKKQLSDDKAVYDAGNADVARMIHEEEQKKRKKIKKAIDSMIEMIEKSEEVQKMGKNYSRQAGSSVERAAEKKYKNNDDQETWDSFIGGKGGKSGEGKKPKIKKEKEVPDHSNDHFNGDRPECEDPDYGKEFTNRRKPKWRKEGESLEDFNHRQSKFVDRVIGDKIKVKKALPEPMKKALKDTLGMLTKALEEEMQKAEYDDSNNPKNYERDFGKGKKILSTEEFSKLKEHEKSNFSPVKVNPTKERAALRVRKAIILTDQQLGKSFAPVDDITLVKAYGSIEAIPDLLKSDRMPQEYFTHSLERISMFDEKPLEYLGKLWYGEAKFEKGVLGSGIGGLAGAALGGPLAGAAGAMAGGAIEDKVGKSKKAEKSLDDLVPWTKAEFDEFSKGVLGSGIGALAGGALGGPLGAAAGSMAGTAIEDKVKKPKKSSEPITEMEKALPVAAMAAAAPKVSEAVKNVLPKELDVHIEKADPKMIKEKCLHLCKSMIELENGSSDLSTLTTDQFNRAFIQASYEVNKAVAEPIDSKFAPKDRKPDSDFGGESEISHNPTTADPSMLQPSEKSEIMVQKNNAAKDK